MNNLGGKVLKAMMDGKMQKKRWGGQMDVIKWAIIQLY